MAFAMLRDYQRDKSNNFYSANQERFNETQTFVFVLCGGLYHVAEAPHADAEEPVLHSVQASHSYFLWVILPVHSG